MSTLPQTERSPEERFVSFLHALAAREDRGALAKLRRRAGKDPDADMLRLVVPYLPEDRPWAHRWYFLTAALFGLHPESGGRGNLGEAFRQLGDNESAQKRFVALLDSHADDLPHRLRQAVGLARSKNVAIDWLQLLNDLLHWDSENRTVQTRWARAYWKKPTSEEAGEPTPSDAANSTKGT
jgi:CRISPR type I-E-associated protein CasB/Cse2